MKKLSIKESADQQKKQFGARLVALRKNAGLTQAQLAERSGFTSSAIARYEAGKSLPREKAIRVLAAALDVPAEDLDGSNDNADKIRLALELEEYHIEAAFTDDYQTIGLRSPDIGGIALPFSDFEKILQRAEKHVHAVFDKPMHDYHEHVLKIFLLAENQNMIFEKMKEKNFEEASAHQEKMNQLLAKLSDLEDSIG